MGTHPMPRTPRPVNWRTSPTPPRVRRLISNARQRPCSPPRHGRSDVHGPHPTQPPHPPTRHSDVHGLLPLRRLLHRDLVLHSRQQQAVAAGGGGGRSRRASQAPAIAGDKRQRRSDTRAQSRLPAPKSADQLQQRAARPQAPRRPARPCPRLPLQCPLAPLGQNPLVVRPSHDTHAPVGDQILRCRWRLNHCGMVAPRRCCTPATSAEPGGAAGCEWHPHLPCGSSRQEVNGMRRVKSQAQALCIRPNLRQGPTWPHRKPKLAAWCEKTEIPRVKSPDQAVKGGIKKPPPADCRTFRLKLRIDQRLGLASRPQNRRSALPSPAGTRTRKLSRIHLHRATAVLRCGN